MADSTENPTIQELPKEAKGFTSRQSKTAEGLTVDEWSAGLRGTEIQDKNQKIKQRPWFAGGVYFLVLAQNTGIFFIVVWALNMGVLEDLQLIFATLIGGTLTQSYLILRLIAVKVFGEISYNNTKD